MSPYDSDSGSEYTHARARLEQLWPAAHGASEQRPGNARVAEATVGESTGEVPGGNLARRRVKQPEVGDSPDSRAPHVSYQSRPGEEMGRPVGLVLQSAWMTPEKVRARERSGPLTRWPHVAVKRQLQARAGLLVPRKWVPRVILWRGAENEAGLEAR